MKTDKDQFLEVYNKFKSILADRNYDFKFCGFSHYINGEYAVLLFGEKGHTNWEETGWEITELKEGDVLTVMYNLYTAAIKSLEYEDNRRLA